MKRIIDYKRYDTDTATLISSGRISYMGTHKDWSVYRTEKGNWFSLVVSNNNDSSLNVLTPDEVIEHLEKAGRYDVIEAYFDIEDA